MPLSSVATALGKDVRRIASAAIENVHDPALMADRELEATIELLVDRLCLSMQLAKPVGLATWAIREARRIGSSRVRQLADSAVHAVLTAARALEADQGRMAAFLEILRGEIDSALAALDREEPPRQPQEDAEITHALLAMLCERDSNTYAHGKATAEWARRLCTAMGVPDAQRAFVELCAALHDIGHVGTPDRILFKPGPLTPEEWEVVREHSAAGQRIVSHIASLSRCGPVVRAHHERWDGLGYPDGLAGETIPFEARIVAVVDAFHAMISDRPYRRAIAPRRALELLKDGSGTQWDPYVVDAMISLFGAPRRTAAPAERNTA